MARLALRPDDLVERAAGVPLEAEAQPLEPEAQRTAAQAAAAVVVVIVVGAFIALRPWLQRRAHMAAASHI